MKRIAKGSEPTTLTSYRSSIPRDSLEDSNIYDDFPDKSREGCQNNSIGNLRKQLLEEQGYICCYCMSRIDCNNSKIEHFKPQSRFRNLQIDYQNLFVSCMGGEGDRKSHQYCDTKKAEIELRAINLLGNIESSINYKKEAKKIVISSDNSDIDNDIDILNLNVDRLTKNRKETYNNIIAKLKEKRFTKPSIRAYIRYYSQKNSGRYEPFCQMVVYFLTKKLNQQGARI